MLQNQINFVKIIIQFLQFLKTLQVKTLQTPSTLFIWVIFGQFLVSKKQLLLSKRLVSCCTQMLKNCDFLVNLNLCCVLVSSCFATFLKNIFFGCFIAIINRFLLVRSEKIFSTFVCEFTMFLTSSLQSSYLDPSDHYKDSLQATFNKGRDSLWDRYWTHPISADIHGTSTKSMTSCGVECAYLQYYEKFGFIKQVDKGWITIKV